MKKCTSRENPCYAYEFVHPWKKSCGRAWCHIKLTCIRANLLTWEIKFWEEPRKKKGKKKQKKDRTKDKKGKGCRVTERGK